MLAKPSNLYTQFSPATTTVPGLLVSAQTLDEAKLILGTQTKWLDLKDPAEGSLGRPSPSSIRELVLLKLPAGMELSIAGGELHTWEESHFKQIPALLSERCFLKMGLSCADKFDWRERLRSIQALLQRADQLIPVYYADRDIAKCPTWNELILFAAEIQCRFVLVDTFDKSQGSLLDHCKSTLIAEMIRIARESGLKVALAGSLKKSQLKELMPIGAAWLGVRGAVCEHDDRTSSLSPSKLRDVLSLFGEIQPAHERESCT